MRAPLNLFETPNGDLGPSWPPVSERAGPLSPGENNTGQCGRVQLACLPVVYPRLASLSRRLKGC